jgi:hypothetical protein
MSIIIRNGKRYDYGSVELTVDGNVIPVSCEIEYGSGEVEEGIIYAGGKPVGRTPGQQSPVEITIRMPRDEWDQLRGTLGPKYKRKEIDLSVAYADTDGATQTDEIKQFRILNDQVSISPGSDAIMQEITGSALQVLPGGIATF